MLALVASLGVACGGTSRETGGEPAAAQVEVVSISFSPSRLEVTRGTEVTWTNEDEGVRHTVTSGLPGDNGIPGVSEAKPPRPDDVFDGNLPDASAEFTFEFTETGSYEYFCRVHPSMTAEVVVN